MLMRLDTADRSPASQHPPHVHTSHTDAQAHTCSPSLGHRLCITWCPAVHLGEALPARPGSSPTPLHQLPCRKNSFHSKTTKNSEPALGAAPNSHRQVLMGLVPPTPLSTSSCVGTVALHGQPCWIHGFPSLTVAGMESKPSPASFSSKSVPITSPAVSLQKLAIAIQGPTCFRNDLSTGQWSSGEARDSDKHTIHLRPSAEPLRSFLLRKIWGNW